MSALVLFRCSGGTLVLPDPALVLVSREDGGNLLVNPPREVWDRSKLSPEELTAWSFLAAAVAAAMLDALPQLEGGCINYWDAGNWALNDQAEPQGRKHPQEFRRVHLHLLGRNPRSTNPSMRWGEAPSFPDFANRHEWASGFKRLRPDECAHVVAQTERLLQDSYRMPPDQIAAWSACAVCGYPQPAADSICAECAVVT
ncbi:MAG: hypothetical protein ABI823_01850 [Bryobacteraceae bacterium]